MVLPLKVILVQSVDRLCGGRMGVSGCRHEGKSRVVGGGGGVGEEGVGI